VFWPDSGTAQTAGGYLAQSGSIMQISVTTLAISPLVSGTSAPDTLVFAPSYLYWTSQGATDTSGKFIAGSGGITRTILPTGGTAETLVSNEDPCISLAVDATSIYWATAPSVAGTSVIKKMPLGGGTITTIATLPSEVPFLGVDDRNLYWATEDTSIGFVPLAGGPAVILVARQMPGPGGFANDATGLYWTKSSGMFGSGSLVWLSPQ
jgi:hypothetical protein